MKNCFYLHKIILMLVISFQIGQLDAQVKIGNNPNTINENSMLELESTDKGFLPPRIPLNSLNSTAPLTATVAEGMLVYSDGGALTDGFYYWSGTVWVPLAVKTRNNYVLVKSVSDLPAPVAGIITLTAGVEYEINGTISLSDRINLNGCTVKGDDQGNDQLVYTGAAELFTGSKTGSLRLLTFSAASGSVFNIDAAGAGVNMSVQNCTFTGCNSIGTIAGVAGNVSFTEVAYYSNTNGITFQNDNIVMLENTFWDASNFNIFERFTGTFSLIRILGGTRASTSANTATALHISGIISISAGSIHAVAFMGTGTYVTGTFSNAWEVDATGLRTQTDGVASGNIYITVPSSTAFSSVGIPVKALGTTSSSNLFRFTSPTNNRLTYIGTKSRNFRATASMSVTQPSANRYFSFYIAKNGVVLNESGQDIKIINSTDQNVITISCIVSMAPGDYIEVYVTNQTSTSGVTIQNMNLSIE